MATANVNRSVDLTFLPTDFSTSYLMDSNLTLKSKQQGFKYFSEGYLSDVVLFEDNNKTLTVSAKCFRSQRKTEKPHALNCTIDRERRHISTAYCTCQAGMIGSCSHIVGLVQALHQWQLLGFTSVPAELTCTSLPQQWNVPRGYRIEPEAVPSLRFINAKMSRKRAPLWNKLEDNRKITLQPEDLTPLKKLKDCSISYVVSEPQHDIQTHLGLVPVGSGLATHAEFYNTIQPQPVTAQCGDLQYPRRLLVEFTADDVPTSTIAECKLIEEKTRDQADSPVWFEERKNRLTASQFGLIKKRKYITDKFISQLKNPRQFSAPATTYGKSNERKAIERYMKATGIHTHKCGLVVNPSIPFLGASPDSKICDKGVSGLLEVKCPYSVRDMTIADSVARRDFCLENTDNGPKLKHNHNYYFQVQGQLMISGADFCDFVVCTRKDMHIERIQINKPFCEELLNTLYLFYSKYYK